MASCYFSAASNLDANNIGKPGYLSSERLCVALMRQRGGIWQRLHGREEKAVYLIARRLASLILLKGQRHVALEVAFSPGGGIGA